MARHDIESAEEIPVSVRKLIVVSGTVAVALVIGVVGPLLGVGTFIAWQSGEFHWALALPLGLLFFFGGLCFLAYAVFVGSAVIVGVVRRDRLLLGETALQCVARDGRVLTRVPYDNIDEVTLVEDAEDEGPPHYTVGINLIDPEREDTVLRDKSPLGGEDGYEVVIRDFYRVSPKGLYKKLLKRRKKHQ